MIKLKPTVVNARHTTVLFFKMIIIDKSIFRSYNCSRFQYKGDFVNDFVLEVMRQIIRIGTTNQRELSRITGYSLGRINKSIAILKNNWYLDSQLKLTKKANELVVSTKPKSAIILAAGYGLRMIPLCRDIPKALLEVKGAPLIERLIEQLHEADVYDISIVVGYKKEQFEYLIDKYNVRLVVNTDYQTKNNLHSLSLVSKKLENSYIVPSDIWCENNPFSNIELYPWYMVTDKIVPQSRIKSNRSNELIRIPDIESGNREIGIAYITEDKAEIIKANIATLKYSDAYQNAFWEKAALSGKKLILDAKIVPNETVYEINTYDDLIHCDMDSSSLESEYINIICDSLHAEKQEIYNIESLKAGMTNRSFLFNCAGHKYIFRIPGEGTDKLINRREEYDVYQQIKDRGICDEVIYMNPDNGYKITKFIEGSRNCDAYNEADVRGCMSFLKEFHQLRLTVGHEFNLFNQIEYYEGLRGEHSDYYDYTTVKNHVLELKSFIEGLDKDYCLTHIDAVPDNFILTGNDIYLIDWEYAAMQDPHVDIAMFAIYSLYDKQRTDTLIDIYFEGKCDIKTRAKIYAYVAVCGLLWSNWCEYKRNLGVEFGEYSLRQYRYAKDYYKYANEIIQSFSEKEDTLNDG